MKKRILATALALTMAMPMTAMAAQKPITVGEFMAVTEGTNGSMPHTVKFEVVDQASFHGTVSEYNFPVMSEMTDKTLRLATAGLTATHDIYYIRTISKESYGNLYGFKFLCRGVEVDGQRFGYTQAAAYYVYIDESGRWWSEAEKQAQYAAGGVVTSFVMGDRWPATVNGQATQIMLLETQAGVVIAVPKGASNVRALFAPYSLTGRESQQFAGTAGIYTDWDNAYYIDLKTGATPASSQTWVSDASGWRVQRSDGSYLTNEWYQSNGLWYYMGADGYMLTNTTTPDGYPVNADGVWVQ